MVETATLLLAASLNLSQGPRVPLVVARSGKTSDFRSSTRTSATPPWIGLFPLVVWGDCALLEGASGKAPDGSCWAAPERHNQHAIDEAMMNKRTTVLRLAQITDSPEITGISRLVSCRWLHLYTRAVSPSPLAFPL